MKTRRWNKNTQFYTAVGLAGILVAVALLGPWLAPHSAFETDFLHTMEAPGRDYPLGTPRRAVPLRHRQPRLHQIGRAHV